MLFQIEKENKNIFVRVPDFKIEREIRRRIFDLSERRWVRGRFEGMLEKGSSRNRNSTARNRGQSSRNSCEGTRIEQKDE